MQRQHLAETEHLKLPLQYVGFLRSFHSVFSGMLGKRLQTRMTGVTLSSSIARHWRQLFASSSCSSLLFYSCDGHKTFYLQCCAAVSLQFTSLRQSCRSVSSQDCVEGVGSVWCPPKPVLPLLPSYPLTKWANCSWLVQS